MMLKELGCIVVMVPIQHDLLSALQVVCYQLDPTCKLTDIAMMECMREK